MLSFCYCFAFDWYLLENTNYLPGPVAPVPSLCFVFLPVPKITCITIMLDQQKVPSLQNYRSLAEPGRPSVSPPCCRPSSQASPDIKTVQLAQHVKSLQSRPCRPCELSDQILA